MKKRDVIAIRDKLSYINRNLKNEVYPIPPKASTNLEDHYILDLHYVSLMLSTACDILTNMKVK